MYAGRVLGKIREIREASREKLRKHGRDSHVPESSRLLIHVDNELHEFVQFVVARGEAREIWNAGILIVAAAEPDCGEHSCQETFKAN